MPELQDDLEGQEAQALKRALTAADDARAILREDLPAFIEREVRKRFLNSPAFADSLSDGDIAAIKRDVATTGAEARDAILADLQGDEPWLAGVEHATAEVGGSFEANAALWGVVSRINASAQAVLDRNGFPSPADPEAPAPTYRQPAFFVGGRHMKAVAEHYWRALRDVRELRQRRDQIADSRRAEELQRRWDDA